MSNNSDSERLEALEKKVAQLASLLHYQDSMRVQIEKSIGVIDQQLMRTDAGLHQLQKQAGAKARKNVKPPTKRKMRKMKSKKRR